MLLMRMDFILTKLVLCLYLMIQNTLQLTLSSKLFAYSYKNIFSSIELGENGYQYNKHALVKVPIILPEVGIELHKKEDVDAQIYELYRLDEEEISFIESLQIQ